MNHLDQTCQEAAKKFVEWLHRRVIQDATGETVEKIDTNPFGKFWLGRLASEEGVLNSDIDSRGDRLDPCSMGIRFRPNGGAPWNFKACVRIRAWKKEEKKIIWHKSELIEEVVVVQLNAIEDDKSFGKEQIKLALQKVTGVDCLCARIDVSCKLQDDGTPEIEVTLVNSSPEKSVELGDTHLYECSLELTGITTQPYILEALPDSFRYDRRVPAYGINCGVVLKADGTLVTCDEPLTDKFRPSFWPEGVEEPKFTFDLMATDPFPLSQRLLNALSSWGDLHWGDPNLRERARSENWSPSMFAEARKSASFFKMELDRIEAGIQSLSNNPILLKAFRNMNAAMAISARGKYDSWRPFQLGFLLSNLADLISEERKNDVADVVWFATGGGKTETYLGLLLTAAFVDRLKGKLHGITGWSRFPLRMLSLQQTQRFANALAGAEIVRREQGIGGEPFSLGFFVGSGATPNSIKPDPRADEPDPDDDDMPKKYRILERCPFCREESVVMGFDHASWTLEHRCENQKCFWPERALPFYIVDDEIYRFLPTVVVGTLDKAANLGMQASMRGFVAQPLGYCSVEKHGHVYATRSIKPNGCLVPGCRGQKNSLPQDTKLYSPSIRLQDELHLLRDSLGAVDSHYEALLDSLESELVGHQPKILASSATLSGYEKQIDVLYRRTARLFPQPSPKPGVGFWTSDTDHLMRRYIAIAPRGVTIEHTIDRIVSTLQSCVRELLANTESVCKQIGVDPMFGPDLISLYGTDVVYGNTLRDLDAVERSIDGQQVRVMGRLDSRSLTGRTIFEDVRETLNRLEKPESNFEDRIHVVTASSMMSHGVDIDRLNVMIMIGLPLGTAEFIQTTARVGRTWPGLVFVLHKISRERDAAVYRTFEKFIAHGDRFVEPIPITRRSRRVLERTLPGLQNARLLHVHEPQASGPLTTPSRLRDYRAQGKYDLLHEEKVIREMLKISGPLDEPLSEELAKWMVRYGRLIDDPPTGAKFCSQLYPGQYEPMRSLRDVEEQVPIYGREEE